MQIMDYSRIFVTGASSGIGAALARAYARPNIILGLAARRVEKLKAVAQDIRDRGAQAYIYELDITDIDATECVAQKFVKSAGGIDLVIANAGIGGWAHPVQTDPRKLTTIINTNVNGVINTVGAFLPSMVAARRGHLAVLSSIAGFRGLPGGVYSASKVAIRYMLNGWRFDLKPYNIHVTTLYPGFVETEMTGSKRWYPFLISADQAAVEIKRAIQQKKAHWVFPWPWRLIVPILRILPGVLIRRPVRSLSNRK
ncbi:SDR family NAD(P)-dependent oxidoreductase [Candidatus Berkelbacteria bacterium]|nr:SDR family NAD(P)-dependent oxidoreductase [Candidatus Berkelbacteria bacterium]